MDWWNKWNWQSEKLKIRNIAFYAIRKSMYNIDAELFLEKFKLITLLEFDQPQLLRTFSRIVMRVKVQCLQSQQLSE